MKKVIFILKIVGFLIAIFAIILGSIIVYALISDYKPAEKEVIAIQKKADVLADSITISILSWNIGYAGLDKSMDFFYDGGKMVTPPKENVERNIAEIKKFIQQNDSCSFILLQEVDKNSKRSHAINEVDILSLALKNHSTFFAKNYDVFFVPIPFTSPMGKVLSGLVTFSKYGSSEIVRYAFPGEYGFPKQLFMLDRCFLANRYKLSNGKELLIINTHNEAFDPGDIRKAQMAYLKKFLLTEYEKGNYVVVGGDWNQCPPAFAPKFDGFKLDTIDKMDIPTDFMPSNWTWAYDNTIPTNRRVVAPYNKEQTLTTLIDFFLLSPNIELQKMEGINLNFENSDHNPVRISFKLKK